MSDPGVESQEQHLNTLAFQRSLTGMAFLSAEGTFVSLNPAFCSIMGYEREQLLGKHVDSIRHPADIESLYEAKPKVLDAIGLETSAPSADPKERRFVDRNGNTIWANVAVSVLRTSPGRQLYFIQVQAITEHKPLQTGAERSLAQMIDMLEHSTDGFFAVDSQSRFTYVNRSAEMFFGRSRAHLIGLSFTDVFPEAAAQAIAEHCSRILTDHRPNLLELYDEPGNRWIEINASPLADSFSVLFRDVTDRRQAEAALRESEELHRILTEHCSDIISKHTGEGDILYASPSSKTLLGYEAEELIGTNIFDYFHPEDLRLIQDAGDYSIMATEMSLPPYRMRTKQGEYLWLETNIRRVSTPEPGSKPFVWVSRDISARKKNEQQLLKTNELLQKISSIDALTGLANRRSFDENYAREWRHGLRFATPLSVILLDIDYFKRYNDNYGHHEGDLCLQQVAEALLRAAKRPGDFIARFGGEEFIIVLPMTDESGAAFVAEQLRYEIERLGIPHTCSDVSTIVTASLGFATLVPSRELSPQELLIRADRALYQAKQEGRNQVKGFLTA
ncbi:PAS domain S-box protein [Paenibacillus validus]|uniref:sensor domain-containing diguanylate cyclase n=1 Tax=Paenibacillus TaxID=44249 RepID=UPI000FD819DE|nr:MULTISPECIES: GGDEF domain-containing protein [Paenibacillus]MED4602506.1 PAS domain S-box protein [Paenibacillus validus]MED4608336.1 PAS domain S-box protein [Paenibacillus validus]